jgi:hypothetical protein
MCVMMSPFSSLPLHRALCVCVCVCVCVYARRAQDDTGPSATHIVRHLENACTRPHTLQEMRVTRLLRHVLARRLQPPNCCVVRMSVCCVVWRRRHSPSKRRQGRDAHASVRRCVEVDADARAFDLASVRVQRLVRCPVNQRVVCCSCSARGVVKHRGNGISMRRPR